MSQSKTEEPTPKRLREARKKGDVPRSRELTTALILLVVAAVLGLQGGAFALGLRELYAASIVAIEQVSAGHGADGAKALELMHAGMRSASALLLPILLAAMLTAALVAFIQVGPLFASERIRLDPSHLDPIRGLGRIFSQRQLAELLKTSITLVIVIAVAVSALRESVRGVAGLAARDAGAALVASGELVQRLLLHVGAALLFIGALDRIYQRWRHRREHRMTREEVRREHREAEGDPHAKRERERLHREIVEHAILEEVRQADVLIVNPTHLAIALRYDEDEHEAPEVRARGQDELARRMIAAAEEAGVPVLRDIPLAHALYELQEGEQIPERLYDAVAAVLHVAWQEREREEGD